MIPGEQRRALGAGETAIAAVFPRPHRAPADILRLQV